MFDNLSQFWNTYVFIYNLSPSNLFCSGDSGDLQSFRPSLLPIFPL